MANVTLKGNSIHTSGELPKVGTSAPEFKLVKSDLSEASLSQFSGKRKVLNIFPSVDTGTCAMSVRKFNEEAGKLDNMAVLNISADLPFAQARFCGAEGIKNVEVLSAFRSSFSSDYGLKITDGPLAGLCSRAVIVLDEQNKVLYTEQVPEIAQEPNYQKALEALKK
jgi:thiol peroxidase